MEVKKMLELVSKNADLRFDKKTSYEDHCYLLKSYFQSYKVRNLSINTIIKEEKFLNTWFEEHGTDDEVLYTWKAMEPVVGRKRVVDYSDALLETGIKTDTLRSYLGILRRYFSYVIDHPFIIRDKIAKRIDYLYGSIEQVISEYDIPKHVYNGEKLGVPLDPESLYSFYSILRRDYISASNDIIKSRNYTMAVLAGESGLRANELSHLELSDIFFKSHKLQTRYAKGTKGSGKRSRITLLPPLSRDTLLFYIKHHRLKILKKNKSDYLFPSRTGSLITYNSMHNALQEMVKVAIKSNFSILNHMSWHWFRRIFATRFIERFPNKLSILIELLGHTSPNTVHCYIRHSEAWMDKEMQKVLEGVSKWGFPGD
jgi:integrase